MMLKMMLLITLVSVMGLCQTVSADVGKEIKEGALIENALNNAVNEGFTIDQAVADAITVNTEMARDIVAAALAMLENLPVAACTVMSEESISQGDDQNSCRKRILFAAIMAGADPAAVTEATAAGSSNGTLSGLGGPTGPGAPRYYLGRP